MAEQASVGRRIVAIIIDHIVLAIIMIIVAIPFGLTATVFGMMTDVAAQSAFWSNAALGSFLVINTIIWLLYFSYFESKSGQTLGKKAMDLKVVKKGGSNLSFGAAFVRTIFRVIDSIAFYLLGFIIVLITKDKQRLGDLAVDSVVVKA